MNNFPDLWKLRYVIYDAGSILDNILWIFYWNRDLLETAKILNEKPIFTDATSDGWKLKLKLVIIKNIQGSI